MILDHKGKEVQPRKLLTAEMMADIAWSNFERILREDQRLRDQFKNNKSMYVGGHAKGDTITVKLPKYARKP